MCKQTFHLKNGLKMVINIWKHTENISGLTGSVIDSILGALFQYSGQDVETRLIVSEAGDGVRQSSTNVLYIIHYILYDKSNRKSKKRHIAGWDVLDNHGVNILMSTTSAILGPLFYSVCYGYFR